MSELSRPREAVLALPPAAHRRKLPSQPPLKRLPLPVIVPDPDHRGPNAYLAAMPSWLVSFVIHLTAILGLGFANYRELPGQETIVLLVAEAPEATDKDGLAMIVADPLAKVPVDGLAQTGEAPAIFGDTDDLSQLPLNADDLQSEIEVAERASDPLDIGELAAFEVKPRDDAGGPAAKKAVATFCGVEAHGNRFVFVIDNSGSMDGTRLDEAKREVMEAVEHLEPTQSFYVFFFNERTVPMFAGQPGKVAHEPLAATKQNIASLKVWMRTVRYAGGTQPNDAIRQALQMRPDAIYLLSDGEIAKASGVSQIFAASKRYRPKSAPQAVIHTIGFYDKASQPSLTKIAQDCGGNYRFVPDPNPGAPPAAFGNFGFSGNIGGFSGGGGFGIGAGGGAAAR